MTSNRWRASLRLFFTERARAVEGVPSLNDLCFVSGREPRLWGDTALYQELVDHIIKLSNIGPASKILEVGCAAGFLARGLAPRARTYVGLDIAQTPLDVAARLGLLNASFVRGDGAALEFASSSFDAAICYDVFTNFPRFTDGEPLIREMIRVVRPGGTVLVGSVPDAATKERFEVRVGEVTRLLEQQCGPLPERLPPTKSLWERLPAALGLARRFSTESEVVCYYFDRRDFVETGDRLGVSVEITDIHDQNPYYGFRFNVVYRKPQH